jgi:RNA polymerase sigma-70 factor (ECF subfamily)
MHREWQAAVRGNASDARLVRIAFDHCHGMVYSVAHRITGSPHDAEDITQSVFETLARRVHDIRDPLRIPGFLKCCVVRKSSRHLRRARWRKERLIRVSPREQPANDADRDAHWVRLALDRLDPEEREAALLKHVKRHTHAEVARLLDVSTSTARRRIASADSKLREQLVA